ncbi:MAG: histidine phosphatase family protein [Pseudolysinimonas sp.]
MASSSDIRRLFLVRHGQTALNAAGRLRGLADPPLDDVGVAEAKAVAEDLGSQDIGAVYCSPLQRAVHTAQAIAEASGAEWTADPRFNDRDYGPWTGHIRDEVIAEFGSVDDAPGVEPKATVLERARPALDSVLDAHPDAAVAIVTHDAVIRPLLAAIDPSVGEVEVPTGSWSELRRDAGEWTIVRTDQKP